MLSDFEMIVREFPKEDIRIYPIYDVHLGAAEHMEKEWQEFLKTILNDPNAYCVIGGDLLNNGVPSSVSNSFAEVMRPREAKRQMVEMLTPIKDRILCAVQGNHERRNRDVDNDIIYDIMCKLDLEHLYRENIAFLHLYFGNKKNNGDYNPAYILAAVHGSGGGALTGGVLNKAERFAYSISNLDALIVGHSHKPLTSAPATINIDPQRETVTIKPFRVVIATSWLNWGGYAAQKMLTPTSSLPQVINLCGSKKRLTVTF